MKPLTHVGVIRANNATVPEGYRRLVKLREFKNYWQEETGRKWCKRRGTPIPRQDWPSTRLDLAGIERLPASAPEERK